MKALNAIKRSFATATTLQKTTPRLLTYNIQTKDYTMSDLPDL